MWTKELFGTDVYHFVATFVIYSILGWLVESIYMSVCNRKWTNRGFAKSPFCPIYGFGGALGYLMLAPLRDNVVVLYIASALLATGFEFLVGKLMIGLFGELWWDYNEKPFNYKGIICLESTVAWGFYGVGIICFLHGQILRWIDSISPLVGQRLIAFIMAIVFIDYVYQLCVAFKVDVRQKREWFIEKYLAFKARWY